VMLWAVSRAPLAKLQAFKQRMGWTFPWASSSDSDFNSDFNIYATEEQQRAGAYEYNFRGGTVVVEPDQEEQPELSDPPTDSERCCTMYASHPKAARMAMRIKSLRTHRW